jgi:hypothetical protein
MNNKIRQENKLEHSNYDNSCKNNLHEDNLSDDISLSNNHATDFRQKKEAILACEICDYITCKKSNYDAHILTQKHIRNISVTSRKKAKERELYFCNDCNYETRKKSTYETHLLSVKHVKKVKGKEQQKEEYSCKCGLSYVSRSGLWRHQKSCSFENTNELASTSKKTIENEHHTLKMTPELIMLLIHQNKEMQQIMVEQQKYFAEQQNNYMKQQNVIMEKMIENGGNNHHNNTINNNDNKSFNLNFFLNETCKNAMNLSDFVNGVDISLDDFEETGRIGYVEGLSRIFCKELRKLSVTERPIHCSDAKRETIYIRENNRWEKDENKERLLRAVKQIGKKNIKVLTLWQEKYPGYKDVESKENDRYLHILTNIMCGETEEEIQSNYGKIMKNISRVTVVDKRQ